jgi:hypothetical protein
MSGRRPGQLGVTLRSARIAAEADAARAGQMRRLLPALLCYWAM